MDDESRDFMASEDNVFTYILLILVSFAFFIRRDIYRVKR